MRPLRRAASHSHPRPHLCSNSSGSRVFTCAPVLRGESKASVSNLAFNPKDAALLTPNLQGESLTGLISCLIMPTTLIQTHPNTGRPETKALSYPTTATHMPPTPHQPAASTDPETKVTTSLLEPEQSEDWERVEFSRENIYKFLK